MGMIRKAEERDASSLAGSTDFVIADQAYENYLMRTNLRQPVD
jgi:hypothetical protein